MNIAPPPPYAEPSNGQFQSWDTQESDYKYSFEKPEKPIPSPSYDESFPISTPKYNDKLFTYIFIATLTIFTYITYNSYSNLDLNPNLFISDFFYQPEKISKPIKALYTMISISIIIPLLCSIALLLLVYIFPTFFVITAFLLIPLSMFSISITSFISGSIFSGLMFGCFGFLTLMFMFQNFNRFSFSALMIKLIVSAMKKYPSTILISLLSSLLTAVISLIYMISISIIFNYRINKDDSICQHSNGNDICISNTSILIFLFSIFSGCYIFQVLENITHVTLSGIFSSWYFFDTIDLNLKPKFPAFGSLKRALTYCFGSICFGSLLVSIIQTIRISLQVLKAKLQNRNFSNNNLTDDDNDYGGGENGLLLCFLICIVSILEWIANEFEYWMRWFNRYAYSYLSMYGKPYLQSARDTFEILKYKGIDILINDSLISTAISLYSMLSMIITGFTLYIIFTTWNIGGILEMGPEMLVIGGIIGLIICYFIVSSAINVLDVGCVTFMIGLAVDPDAFTRTNAGGASESSIQRLQAWEQLSRYYPGIRERVMLDWPENNN
ncbi:putative choline transporter, neither null mutation nor overexpression affects choline transport [Pichia californica]|uniref:Protein PNS1 n=1 Tax=Pichia californica TaxID=460514 RepID=A0A9P6WQL4_9ASCO|nr:putative choline transporter, neither null mutation nor overexpression affects choline transport [[Candida] californica]KAG0690457.1 putative choline transporter, neither null mutation nor overexpression affects choline transport [[Candida] californica]